LSSPWINSAAWAPACVWSSTRAVAEVDVLEHDSQQARAVDLDPGDEADRPQDDRRRQPGLDEELELERGRRGAYDRLDAARVGREERCADGDAEGGNLRCGSRGLPSGRVESSGDPEYVAIDCDVKIPLQGCEPAPREARASGSKLAEAAPAGVLVHVEWGLDFRNIA
jgi:hypothetical protein